MAAVTSVYFLASSLPTFQFLDFAVKGSVAIFFQDTWCKRVDCDICIYLNVVSNVVLPVIIGSYYVLNFKATNNRKIQLQAKHI
jgi:hypothetical protein